MRAPRASTSRELGYTDEQIDGATLVVCGRQTVEGAPFLEPEDPRLRLRKPLRAAGHALHRAHGHVA